MIEWARAKDIADAIELEGKELEFDEEEGCLGGCDLLVRKGILCRHWLAYFYIQSQPVPLSIFYPRWLFDGPPFLSELWRMSLPKDSDSRESHNSDDDIPPEPTAMASSSRHDRYASDKFALRGKHVVTDNALKVQDTIESLPPGEGAILAAVFEKSVQSLLKKQAEVTHKKNKLPAESPPPMVQPKLKYSKGKQRAMTGEEIALKQEKYHKRKERRREKAQLLTRDKAIQQQREILAAT
jgi:hypothetical protein